MLTYNFERNFISKLIGKNILIIVCTFWPYANVFLWRIWIVFSRFAGKETGYSMHNTIPIHDLELRASIKQSTYHKGNSEIVWMENGISHWTLTKLLEFYVNDKCMHMINLQRNDYKCIDVLLEGKETFVFIMMESLIEWLWNLRYQSLRTTVFFLISVFI